MGTAQVDAATEAETGEEEEVRTKKGVGGITGRRMEELDK